MKRLFAVLLILIFVFSSISAIAAHENVNPEDVHYFMTYSQFKFMYENYYIHSRSFIPEWEIKGEYECWCCKNDFDPVW